MSSSLFISMLQQEQLCRCGMPAARGRAGSEALWPFCAKASRCRRPREPASRVPPQPVSSAEPS